MQIPQSRRSFSITAKHAIIENALIQQAFSADRSKSQLHTATTNIPGFCGSENNRSECVDTRAADVVEMKARLRKRLSARQMRPRPGLPTVDRKIEMSALLLGHTTDGLPEVLRLPLEVSHQVTALLAPTSHAKDLTNAGYIAFTVKPL